jgi:predicted site-specific integrase-resolvase
MSLEHDPARDGACSVDPLFLTLEELAERWRVSPRTLERWRSDGEGPPWVRLKGKVIYPAEGVRAYERARLMDPDG